jgi:hypothetical protein
MESYILNDNKVTFPSSWEECTYGKFLAFVRLSDKLASNKEDETDNEYQQTLNDLKQNTKVLSFWLGVSEDEISMMDLDVANDIMSKLSWVGEKYTPINIDSFTIGDEKFYLPKDLMAKSSFGRFIEAEQLELQANMLDNGIIEILPRQIAILCKKEGEEEKLNDALIDERAKKFEKLDMATIWDVGFFLSKLEQKLTLNFLISTEKEEKESQKLQQKAQ